jgi:phosphatidylglycerol---prolipoprotein diacylglyceryl transferase
MSVALLAVALAAGTVMGGGLPYFDVPTFRIPGIGLHLQVFGMLVATGVLVGAELCRRYSLRFGIDDDDLRKLTGWVVVSGFIGAHWFDVLAYQPGELHDNPLIMVEFWKGISSYGGFIGGTVGFAAFVGYKRMRPGLLADVIMVGLLPGFAIGRIGCTIVSDHIGRTTDFFLGFDYPLRALQNRFCTGGLPCPMKEFPGAGPMTRAHNLGFYELMYLIVVCAVVLPLAFRRARTRPLAGGFIAVLVGLLYAPVRFFLEFLRFNSSDPRYLGLTFAQWASIVAFVVAAYLLVWMARKGKPAPLAAELDGVYGGYKEGVAAPKVREEPADDEADDAKGDKKKARAKPAPKKPSGKRAGKKRR